MANEDHLHGGDPERELKRLGIDAREILDFSVNVSPLGVPPEIKAIWQELLAEVDRYPSVDGQGVARYYQERFDLDPARVLAGNGSTELIYLTPRALQLRKVAVITPSFHDYTRSSLAAGADVLEVKLGAEESFAPPGFDILEEVMIESDGLFVGNPNNPTSTVFPRQLLLDLAASFPSKWILVDEAFVQFFDEPEEVSLIRQEPPQKNILVFHSLTKFFALPGLRLGAVVGHPDTISRLRPLKEPWSVNRVAEKVALKLIGCADYEDNVVQLIRQERPRVLARIREISGFQAFEPAANFLLARWIQTNDLDDFLSFMLRSGIHFRDCRNFPGLENNFFRMAIRQGEENDRVLKLMQSCSIRYS
ncbi:MAG: threonine-phosphate decarboxylase CobD [Deltaproteobacteria bacterium]|nr:threonine-phosphate decarboxylase CobD [Deltaproteobacteria bacterium]